jgi:hypothetical protein
LIAAALRHPRRLDFKGCSLPGKFAFDGQTILSRLQRWQKAREISEFVVAMLEQGYPELVWEDLRDFGRAFAQRGQILAQVEMTA